MPTKKVRKNRYIYMRRMQSRHGRLSWAMPFPARLRRSHREHVCRVHPLAATSARTLSSARSAEEAALLAAGRCRPHLRCRRVHAARVLAVGATEAGGEGHAAHESRPWRLCMRLMYRFRFGLFLLACRLASARVRWCCVGWACRAAMGDLDSDSQRKLWEFSVLCASRALCALARAAAHRPRRFIARPASSLYRV